MTVSDAQFAALEARVKTAEESIGKLFAALPPLFAFRDNFELWAKETGVFDHIVQEVLAKVPKASTNSAPVSSSVVVPADFAAQVLAVLRTADVRFDGKVGFGCDPKQDTDARITLRGGQILGTNAGNFQNPVEHENILDICNSDGGIRFLQYHRYFNGQKIQNTANRPMSIFAIFDSMGDSCISDSRKPYGQVFYITKDGDGNVTLSTYQVGSKIAIKESTGVYGGVETQKL